MRQAQWGRIVNVISTSVKEPIPGLGVSNTIRGAVASWAKTLSRELAADGITVNNVLPGFTETGRIEQIVRGKVSAQGKSEDEVRAAMRAGVPAGRFATPQETGGVIAFLCSPAARSEEHTSELQSLMRISYAVFCLQKTKQINQN